MKSLIFDEKLERNKEFETNLTNSLAKYSFLDVSGVVAHTNLDHTEINTIANVLEVTGFLFHYVNSILSRNEAASSKEKAPSPISCDLKVTKDKLQLKIFISDLIFGLVVGKQFKNVITLVKACIPIFAKSAMKMEVRFYPQSRRPFLE